MRLLRLIVVAIVVTLTTVLTYGEKFTVIGRDDCLPVAGVTLLSKSGHISSLNLNILARGKIFKWIFRSSEPLRMNTCIELYPVEITSHSLEEYKELRKDRNTLEFRLPLSVLPEIPVVSELKKHYK